MPGKFQLALTKESLEDDSLRCLQTVLKDASLLLEYARVSSADQELSTLPTFAYSTEADISNIVSPIVMDAIQLARAVTGIPFQIRHETSLFSHRPDHLVVFDALSKAPLVAVEDKKPWRDEQGVEEKESVLGQIFDYATAMRAFGSAAPFVVLTCIEESYLFWLDDDASNKAATNDQDMRNEKAFKESRKKWALASQDDKKTPSPPDLKSEAPSPEEGAASCIISSKTGGDHDSFGVFSTKGVPGGR